MSEHALQIDQLFGRLVVEKGYARPEHVEHCLRLQKDLAECNFTPLPRLGDLLVEKGYLSPSQLRDTLVTAQSDVSGIAGSPERTPDAAASSMPEAAHQALQDPRARLGKYIKVKILGSGGMGEVWKAWDTQLHRWVALKFLKHHDAEDDARFLREARTAAALIHPNIAAIYESTTDCIAMQYVEGETLVTLPRNDVRRLVEILREVSLAIHAAHERGIIHRDIKPANLMVEPARPGEDAKGRIYVMDFGLARSTSVPSHLTLAGLVVGTPCYMSPEQARGISTVGAGTDIYALGATLYELLTNRAPFVHPDIYVLLQKVVDEEPAPVRVLAPAVNRELEAIVMKCLEKEPARRYPSARELADDLGRWLAGEPVRARRSSATFRAWKRIKRRPLLSSLVIAAVLLVLLAWILWREGGQFSDKSTFRGSKLEGHLFLENRQYALARQAYEQAYALEPNPASRASLRTNIGWAWELSGDRVRAIEEYSRALTDYHEEREALRNRGRLRALKGDFQGALEDLNRAIKLRDNFGPAYLFRARVNLELGRGQAAQNDLEQCLQLISHETPQGFRKKTETLLAELRKGTKLKTLKEAGYTLEYFLVYR